MASPRSPRGLSIRVKSVLLALGYLLALSIVYGSFTLHLLQREMSEAHDRFEQTARIVAAELDSAVAAGVQRLETVSRLPGLVYGLQTIQEATTDGYIPPWTTLHYLFFKSPLFNGGVLLLDRNGSVLWTEPPGLPWLHQVLLDLPTIAEARATSRRRISGVLDGDRLSRQPHVVLAVPIQNDAGEVQGVLAGVIDLAASDFRDLLRAVSTSEGRFVEVVDQHGVVLATTNAARLHTRADALPPQGEAPLLASVALTTAPWHVVAGQPRSLGLAAVWRSQRALWAVGIGVVLAATLVAVPILNGFVRSIRQLTDAAETVARGDLSKPLFLRARRDELATLGRAFEQMRVELGHSRRALELRLEEREKLIRSLVERGEELRAVQARLIDAERFAAIGELSAAVAHGIRNPVAGIKIAAQFAGMELPHDHPLHESIADIITEADKLETRIMALLDFAKPFEPKLARCRIDQIVEQAVASLRSHMAMRGIELTVQLEPALPEMELDDAQIEQVLLAILSNAAEATPAGGRVSITGRLTEDRTRVRLEVSDTGSGMRPDQVGRIFQLFYTTKPSGTGFGLAVAKNIVERHAGTITVDSTVGEGSRFTIELPLASSEQKRPLAEEHLGRDPLERS